MSTHDKKKRVAIFVESHEGYGHFNIVSQLARKLQDRDAEVMVLSGTLTYAGAAETFNFRHARLVHLPLVDYKIRRGGRWEYITSQGDMYEQSPADISARKGMIQRALADFQPDLILSEFFPFQQSFRSHDAEAIDEFYAASLRRPERITLCRDIIHNSKPDYVLKLLHKHFDRIWVRGDKNFSDLRDSQAEWANIKLPIEYMGNYVTAMPKREKDIADSDRHVIVFGGGGYFDKDLPFFESIIRARRHSQKFSTRIWDIYVSENMRKHTMPDPADPTVLISTYDYLLRASQ